jgi:hypothetical protein
MMPYQVAFGLISTFVPYYIFGTVVADSPHLGNEYVGALSAISVLVGACIAVPSARLANYHGKQVMMVGGGLMFCLNALLIFFTTNRTLGTWAMIVPYLVIVGIGRGIWVSGCTVPSDCLFFLAIYFRVILFLTSFFFFLSGQENTNKSVVADLYAHKPDSASAAFAAVYFSSGLSGNMFGNC